MSNYRGGIDLLKLVGAKVVSVPVNGKPMNCILVPAAWNDVSINADSNGQPKSAYLNYNLWETRENFRRACQDRNADKEGYVAPSHEFTVHYSEDFVTAACKAAEARLRTDEKFMANNPSEDEIKKQAKYAVWARQRIGMITPIQPKPATPYTSAAPAAPDFSAYQPQTPEVEDDLPF